MRLQHPPRNSKRSTVGIALALIITGAVLTFGPTFVLNAWDAYVAKVRNAETAHWMTAHLKPSAVIRGRPRANVSPSFGVIEPGRDGYLLAIPRLNVQLVVHMLEPAALTGVPTPILSRYGLGQIPYTSVLENVSPGGNGTTAIAGHRTTHGAPFRHLDLLQPGDLIVVRKGADAQQWRVNATAVIAPTDVDAIRSHPGVRRLVLLACTPPFSAKSRLMIVAQPAGEPPAADISLRATPPSRPAAFQPPQDPRTASPASRTARPRGLVGVGPAPQRRLGSSPAEGAAVSTHAADPAAASRTTAVPMPAASTAVPAHRSAGLPGVIPIYSRPRHSGSGPGGYHAAGAARSNNRAARGPSPTTGGPPRSATSGAGTRRGTYVAAPGGKPGGLNRGIAVPTTPGPYSRGGDVMWSAVDRQHERGDGGAGDHQVERGRR